MRNLVFTLTFVVLFTIPPATTVAQLPGTEIMEVVVKPESPGPNQNVSVKINSYAIDVNRADISWTLDGKLISSGKGLRTFEFRTGNSGTKNTLEIMLISFEGYPSTKILNFYPAGVDLISEAKSYTPPFYRGKAYFPYQGKMKIVAIPNIIGEDGKSIPNNQLVFKWKNGDQLLKDSSGIGKNVLLFSGTVPVRSKTISVEVSSFDGKYFVTKEIETDPVEPKVVIYENHPEYGILYNKAVKDTLELNADEITLVAIPYFFNTVSQDDSFLNYEWNLNGKIIKNNGNSIVLKNPGGTGGQAFLSLQLSNTIDIFQFANANLAINFGTATKNLFGR